MRGSTKFYDLRREMAIMLKIQKSRVLRLYKKEFGLWRKAIKEKEEPNLSSHLSREIETYRDLVGMFYKAEGGLTGTLT